MVVDDHTMFRQGLKSILEREPDMVVVGEAGDGQEAIRKAASLDPDVVLMDIGMPRMNGLEATSRILNECPRAKVVALTVQHGEDYACALLKAGARGYVLKESACADLVEAIRVALRGGAYLHPSISARVVESLQRPGAGNRIGAPEALTPREREVLQLIAEGSTSKEIAVHLSLSVKTVISHRTRLMKKLGIHNVAGLIRFALTRGIASPGEPIR
ncbi:MAG TPA: response regulator transcription factor [Candidatus Polarisedimenticolia bacterium]|nr:response regulator transcription factor [Candidatus Polarisedimenticolia bacterium]